MNKGIEILIARMESNPDEFTGTRNKWADLIERAEDFMEPEDRKALTDKFNALQMEKFTELVMKKLLEDQQEKSEAFGNYAQALGASMQQTKNQLAQAALQQQYANNTVAQATGGYTLNAVGNAAGQLYMSNGVLAQFTTPTSANTVTGEIHLGKQTLSEKTLKRLKALIK